MTINGHGSERTAGTRPRALGRGDSGRPNDGSGRGAAGPGARGGMGGACPGYNTGRNLRVPTPSTAGHGHEAHELATYRDQLVTGSFIMCP